MKLPSEGSLKFSLHSCNITYQKATLSAALVHSNPTIEALIIAHLKKLLPCCAGRHSTKVVFTLRARAAQVRFSTLEIFSRNYEI